MHAPKKMVWRLWGSGRAKRLTHRVFKSGFGRFFCGPIGLEADLTVFPNAFGQIWQTQAMEKHFNTAGPSVQVLHYQLDPLERIDFDHILDLIHQRRYFVLHAPRQTGKTTCLLAIRDKLNLDGDFASLYVNVEPAQARRSDVSAAMLAIASQLAEKCAEVLGDAKVLNDFLELAKQRDGSDVLRSMLRRLSELSAKPIVLFLDEVDALIGDTLISLLRQIRAGYTDRPKHFPQSIVLCGVRDVRDYRMTMADGEVITGGSAFNIKAESLRLGDFSRDDLIELYQQHTDATGQKFSEEAIELAWQSTQGQPWLVNALAEQAVWKNKAQRDRSITIDLERMRVAREELILRNDTHLDQLMDKLKEERVRRVIEPMLMGQRTLAEEADLAYVRDLGLISAQREIRPANAIYAEVLPRMLNSVMQRNLTRDDILPTWQHLNGRLNPKQFLLNFQDFWRQHGETMMKSAPYHEAAPHLVLMAYLQRVINGGGRIEREYAAGSGRLDLLVVFGSDQMAIEVKVWRDKQPDPVIEGLEQIERYLNRLDLPEGSLVLFDQRTSAPEWVERMTIETAQTASGKAIMVLRG
jgi:type II secretory pathway predicted ATPase ExeA